MTTNEQLFKRANEVIPGGVNSPVRAFKSVGGTPYFVARASGAYVWDVEGRKYTDYVQSYGASILGHAHPKVLEAIKGAADEGTTFGAPTEGEVRLAEAVVERIGAGCDLVRLVSSGTEATMSAVRLARGATGRDRVVMFEGCYHGHSDGMLAAGGSGMATLGLPASAGVPKASVAETVVVPYNVVPDIGDDVACVIVEPVAANMGLVAPAPGFLEGLRAACDRTGALLIFDEVITGFRVARGGAAELTGVRPDLWTFGKVLGGGLPLAAFAGRRDVMELLAPVGPVYQAGTLSGNPLATAAGLAVLELLDDAAYTMLSGRAAELGPMLSAVLSEVVPTQVPVVGPLVGLFFAEHPVTDYVGAKASADSGMYARFFRAMLDRGVAFAPGAYEAMFPSLAHTWDDIERTVDLARAAIAVA
ncbi:MAG: Glutamate-1-semialdehyde 2,1-aminomutase [uncultured Acidimicrobiales bacterium]|uniref:Glutamate-1-semialdehyde 2,1-aminomutase n=1 Tax=uncultured Acidimicrobiales bacterium TaxID=310071 RepID=A0A6J4HST9_9ACTN|nr:MAG: Glutamate-1-semialdehyde 2,1-aminomutase [uncultured Acidimicrobiales bacterium]